MVVTHTSRNCGSAVKAFIWNMPAGWWEVKCCWTRNIKWYKHTTELKKRIVNSQPRTQPGSGTNPGSEICYNLKHYVALCTSKSECLDVYTRVCACLHVHCMCICVIIAMPAHVTHLTAFCQVLPHAELMPSINSACIFQVKTQQLANCKLLLGYPCKIPSIDSLWIIGSV